MIAPVKLISAAIPQAIAGTGDPGSGMPVLNAATSSRVAMPRAVPSCAAGWAGTRERSSPRPTSGGVGPGGVRGSGGRGGGGGGGRGGVRGAPAPPRPKGPPTTRGGGKRGPGDPRAEEKKNPRQDNRRC